LAASFNCTACGCESAVRHPAQLSARANEVVENCRLLRCELSRLALSGHPTRSRWVALGAIADIGRRLGQMPRSPMTQSGRRPISLNVFAVLELFIELRVLAPIEGDWPLLGTGLPKINAVVSDTEQQHLTHCGSLPHMPRFYFDIREGHSAEGTSISWSEFNIAQISQRLRG
jgi:hypothetical protein